MSNLIKAGFFAFSQNEALVIDANQSKIIKGIDEAIAEAASAKEESLEEALAEALIQEANLDDEQKEENNLLTMCTADIPVLSDESLSDLQKMAEEITKSAKEEAEEIIKQAYEEAERIRAEAYEETVQIKEDAKQEGYQQGYQEAVASAKSEYEKKEEELERKQNESELVLQQEKEVFIKETEHKMVDLLCQLVPTITGVVIENQKDVLLYMINVAMRDLDNSRRFVIKVSDEDYEELSGRKDEIYGALNPNVELEIFEDAKLSSMQCLIETDNGIVDISLDVQFDNLLKALQLMIQE